MVHRGCRLTPLSLDLPHWPDVMPNAGADRQGVSAQRGQVRVALSAFDTGNRARRYSHQTGDLGLRLARPLADSNEHVEHLLVLVDQFLGEPVHRVVEVKAEEFLESHLFPHSLHTPKVPLCAWAHNRTGMLHAPHVLVGTPPRVGGMPVLLVLNHRTGPLPRDLEREQHPVSLGWFCEVQPDDLLATLVAEPRSKAQLQNAAHSHHLFDMLMPAVDEATLSRPLHEVQQLSPQQASVDRGSVVKEALEIVVPVAPAVPGVATKRPVPAVSARPDPRWLSKPHPAPFGASRLWHGE